MRNVGRFLGQAVVSLTILAASAFAQDQATNSPPSEPRGEAAEIEAQVMRFDRPTNMAYGEGDVVIRYKDLTLRADKARFNTATKDLWAEGNVRLNRTDQEWVGPQLYYNLDSRALNAASARGFFDPFFLQGADIAQVASNQYAFSRATITTCDRDPPHFRVQGTHGMIYPGDRVVLHNCTVRFGGVPVFWFPFVVWSLKNDNPPLALAVGQGSRYGFFILTSTSFMLDEDARLTVHLDERTKRGFGSGADLKYHIGTTGEGVVGGYYINDANPNLDELTNNIPRNRYRGQWQHKQELIDDVDLTVDLNKLSDREFERVFFGRDFLQEREPDNVADITKRGPNYTLSFLVRPQFNNFFADVERLPEAKLAVDRTRLGGTPLFYESETSVGQYHNDPGQKGGSNFVGNAVRADTFHQIVVPETLFGWLSVVPRAGVRGTYYSRAPVGAPDTQNVWRVAYDLGVDTSFNVSRTWTDVANERLHINGLRHILEPFADYQWVPTPNVRSNELFQFDTIRSEPLQNGDLLSVTRFAPLDFPAFNSIDAIDGENVVRFGLRQKLQTQRDGQNWSLIDLVGWTDWHAEKQAGEEDFSDFFGDVEVRPYDWIALNGFTRYDFRQQQLKELNTAIRVADTDRWSIGVGTRFLRDDSNLVSWSAACRLTRNWTARLYERFDMEDGRWEEQEYSLRQETHDWLFTYGFRYRSQRVMKDEMAVFVSATLRAFPRIGLALKGVDLGTTN